MGEANFEDLKGKTIERIYGYNLGSDRITINTTDGATYYMYHSQDCCELVYVEDVCGDILDIIGSEILLAEEVISCDENPEGVQAPEDQDSFTWTFYKLATIKGSVTIRWYGESNGFYSESVDFEVSDGN